MTEPIYDPLYWKNRLRLAEEREQLHHAIYLVSEGEWESIEVLHRKLLKEYIGDNDSVLDVGCGWGRLLNLMPETWRGKYLGVDLSPDFIQRARHAYPERYFLVGDMRHLPILAAMDVELPCYDWAILVSIRAMIITNIPDGGWEIVLKELKRVCKKVLILEYEQDDKGMVL